jgi:hypothetical protein
LFNEVCVPHTFSVPEQILPRPVPRCALLVLPVSSTPCQGAVFKPAQSYICDLGMRDQHSSYRADRWLIRCRVCSRRALGKFSLNCYPDTRSLHNAGRRAGQVNRNRCSNVSFTEAIFGLGIRDQKWSREVMNLCGFWWSNCSFPEAIFGLGIRDQKRLRELWPCPGLKNFSKESLRVMISEAIFGLGFRDQK